jgi:predicted permease
VDTLRQDVRYALRTLARRPLFAGVAALSLAVGIGAVTSLFSVVNALVLRPLPAVPGYERAVELGRATQGRGFDTFSYPDFLDMRERVPALEEVAGYRTASFSYETGDGGERVSGQFVSGGYFAALDVDAVRGRVFGAEEDEGFGEHPVAVVSHRFWRNRMGGDASALGRAIRVNRVPLTVVGILPEGFDGHVVGVRTDMYVPLTMSPALHDRSVEEFGNRRSSWMQAIGRLAPGATVREARAQVDALFERLAEAYPESNRNRSARVIPLGPIPGGGRAAVVGFLGALLGLAALVLVVTCANVAGMFLARAAAREREIAVRLAVGSGRARLVRQLLTESLLVFLVGGAGGVAVAWWGTGLLDFGALPVPVEISLDLRPDLTVLGFALLVTLATGVAFGLAPALQATGSDLVTALKDDSGKGSRGTFLRSLFVQGQVGLSLVLLVAAGLFLRSLQEAAGVDTGFEARDVYVTSLDLDLEGYQEGTGLAFADALVERLRDVPGAASAGLAMDLPMDLASHGTGAWPEGWTDEEGREGVGVDYNTVTPGYFETVGISLVQGRAFTPADRAGSEAVVVVSRSFVEEVWPGQDPLGRRLRFGVADAPWSTVVGVVDDVKNQTIMDSAKPFVYRPLHQAYDPRITVLVRSPRPHADVAAAVRAAILDVDGSLSLTPVHSLVSLTSVGVLPQRIAASVASVLGFLALVLAGLGLYGVMAFSVTRRTAELGIRMALGAGAGRILRHVVARGLRVTLPGMAVGAVLGALLARLLQGAGFLLGVPAWDAVAMGGVLAALLVVVVVACAVPARRASRIQPSAALRYE